MAKIKGVKPTYIVARSKSIALLEDFVIIHQSIGYECTGGISYCKGYFLQALTLKN